MKKITLTVFLITHYLIGAFAQTTLSPKVFEEQLKKEKGMLIDVRTPEEFKSERIANAVNINVNDSLFVDEIRKLDKLKSYFVYCGLGKRSYKAACIMKENGFINVYDLGQGIEEWKAQGFPTLKGSQ